MPMQMVSLGFGWVGLWVWVTVALCVEFESAFVCEPRIGWGCHIQLSLVGQGNKNARCVEDGGALSQSCSPTCFGWILKLLSSL